MNVNHLNEANFPIVIKICPATESFKREVDAMVKINESCQRMKYQSGSTFKQ